MYKFIIFLFFAITFLACDATESLGGEGEGCKTDRICNEGFYCDAENICQKRIVGKECNLGETKVCGSSVGVCEEGVIKCINDKWGDICEGGVKPTESEICGDNLDNNCNGEVDEDCGCTTVGEERDCYNGPAGTKDIGICTGGKESCTEEHKWSGICIKETTPIIDTCENVDNDCNGTIDSLEDRCYDPTSCNSGETKECYSGPEATKNIGACKSGRLACEDDKWATVCVGEVLPNEEEICGDGIDNNCNAEIDEGCPCVQGEQRICYTGNQEQVGKGVCHNGIQLCEVGGVWSQTCLGEKGPSEEICDGKDNNCNGIIDEGVSNSCGECGAELVETCNGIDDNCDGRIDEGVMNACGGCGDVPAEICGDGVDNNCNGTIDEDCNVDCGDDINCNPDWECIPFDEWGTPTTRACYTGSLETRAQGLCHDGTQVCINGFWTACQNEVLPNVEVCDSKDNNCNGTVDENCGNNNCSAFEVCNDNIDNDCDGVVDNVELCSPTNECKPTGVEDCSDNLDNDCNGEVNDGCGCENGASQECFSGAANAIFKVDNDKSICVKGTQSCMGGEFWSSCDGEVVPRTETCNGIDDDCDGLVDNGFFIGQACVVGRGICQRTGVYKCNENGTVDCVNPDGSLVEAGVGTNELCDNIDNNCNGIVDEGFTLGAPCNSGMGVCRVRGVTVCSEDGLTVSCNGTPTEPGVEICGDDLDNNCDGRVDNVDGLGATCTTGEGICQVRGINRCVNSLVKCDAVAGTPDTFDACGDNLDNDCDGQIDEGYEQLGQSCTAGLGICLENGNYVCSADKSSLVCSAVANNNAVDEICGDNLDNDCDGQTDDDPELNLGITCSAGEGICKNSGVYVCTNNSTECNAVAGDSDPRGEICFNGLDDNCNGEIDEEPCLSLNGAPVVTCPEAPTVLGIPNRAFTLHDYNFTATANDPDGDQLEYRWEVISAPSGNNQHPTPNNALSTTFEPFLISARPDGTNQSYILRFTAKETSTQERLSASCEVEFLAISADLIHVELTWTNATDMDLHMVTPNGSDSSFTRSSGSNGYDCHYSNCKGTGMSWSGASSSDEYPRLDIDNIPGFNCSATNCNKPENINVSIPRNVDGDVYKIGVYSYNGNGTGLRVKVNCRGANGTDVTQEYTRSSLTDKSFWKIVDVTWHGTYCELPNQ